MNLQFLLIDDFRKNPTEFEILRLEDVDALTNSSFNPNLPVKFFASGWDNDGSIAYPSKDGI